MLNSCHLATKDKTVSLDDNQVSPSQGSLNDDCSVVSLPSVVGDLSPELPAPQDHTEVSRVQCEEVYSQNRSRPPASNAPTLLFQTPLNFDKAPTRSHSIPRYYSAADIWDYKAQMPFSLPVKKLAPRQSAKTASDSSPTIPAETFVSQLVSPAESVPSQFMDTLANQQAVNPSSPPEPRRPSYSEVVQLNSPTSPPSSQQTVPPTAQRSNPQKLVKKRKRNKHPDSPEGNPAPSLRREPLIPVFPNQGLTITPKSTFPTKRHELVNPRSPTSAVPQKGVGLKRKRLINKDSPEVNPPQRPRKFISPHPSSPPAKAAEALHFKMGRKGKKKLVWISFPTCFKDALCPMCPKDAPTRLRDLAAALIHFQTHDAETCYSCSRCESWNQEVEWAIRHFRDCHSTEQVTPTSPPEHTQQPLPVAPTIASSPPSDPTPRTPSSQHSRPEFNSSLTYSTSPATSIQAQPSPSQPSTIQHTFMVPFDGAEKKCPLCKSCFQSHNNTVRHLLRSHKSMNHIFKCRFCLKEWSQLKLAHAHLKKHHPTEWAKTIAQDNGLTASQTLLQDTVTVTQVSPPLTASSQTGPPAPPPPLQPLISTGKPTSHVPKSIKLPTSSSNSQPTESQSSWIRKIETCNSQQELDSIMIELSLSIRGIIEALSSARPSTQPPMPQTRTDLPLPQSSSNSTTFPNRPPQQDIRTATRLQKLFRDNMKAAFREITEIPSPRCPIPHDIICEHFAPLPSESPPPLPLPPSPADSYDVLDSPFSTQEVWFKLSCQKNTSPGPDKIRYIHWKKFDEGGHILTSLFNKCRSLMLVPNSWKTSRTILLHKKGDLNEPSNWRPIALINTAAKLFTACLASRLVSLFGQKDILAPQQKGFLPNEGCLEHNFVLESIKQDARRKNKHLAIAWLDLRNAFGSVPFHTIFQALASHGFNGRTQSIIRELYKDSSTSFCTESGPSPPVQVSSGVKQGCPLSPLIFNIAINSIIREIASLALSHGYPIHNQHHSILAYADDLVLLSDNPGRLQLLLIQIGSSASSIGLSFNPSKCATLHISGADHTTFTTSFTIQGGHPKILGEDDFYTYLGRPSGFKPFVSAASTLKEMELDLDKVDASALAPWQKFVATNTFILSRLSYLLKSGYVLKGDLKDFDDKVTRTAKKWISLPSKGSSTEPLYIGNKEGGLGLFPLRTLADVVTDIQAHKYLSSPDPDIKELAVATLHEAVSKRARRPVVPEEQALFLDGSVEGDIGLPSNDYSSLWARVRDSTVELKKKAGVSWKVSNGLPALHLEGVKLPNQAVEGKVKAAVRKHFLVKLHSKRSQGAVSRCASQNAISNHFIQRGAHTTFGDWKFIHRARLNVLANNGRPWNKKDRSCRKCGHSNETLSHILNRCRPNLIQDTKRHDAIITEISRSLPSTELRLNKQVPGSRFNLRPDIVLLDKANNRACILDVQCPFDLDEDSLVKARTAKTAKYQCVADELRSSGLRVYSGAIIIGSLGSFDGDNFKSLAELGIPRRQCTALAKKLVSLSISHSRAIYNDHIHYKSSPPLLIPSARPILDYPTSEAPHSPIKSQVS